MSSSNAASAHQGGGVEQNSLVQVSLDTLVQMLDNWVTTQEQAIKSIKSKDREEGEDVPELDEVNRPSYFINLLSTKLQSLSDKERDSLTDQERNNLVKLYDRLFELRKVREGIEKTMQGVSSQTDQILHRYSFYSFLTLGEFDNYLDENEYSSDWNPVMVLRFMRRLKQFTVTNGEKKVSFTKLLQIPGVRGIEWNEKMLREFAGILKTVKGAEKSSLRNIFNSMPSIKSVPEIEKVGYPWSTLSPKSGPEVSKTRSSYPDPAGKWANVS